MTPEEALSRLPMYCAPPTEFAGTKWPACTPIGFWSGSPETATAEHPWPIHGESTLTPQELNRVAHYLLEVGCKESGRYCSEAICRVCYEVRDHVHGVGASEYSDGVYCWPVGLAHYLLVHRVKLPSPFVGRALEVVGDLPYRLVTGFSDIPAIWRSSPLWFNVTPTAAKDLSPGWERLHAEFLVPNGWTGGSIVRRVLSRAGEPMSEDLRRAIETAELMAHQPLQLTQEDRAAIVQGVLEDLGLEPKVDS